MGLMFIGLTLRETIEDVLWPTINAPGDEEEAECRFAKKAGVQGEMKIMKLRWFCLANGNGTCHRMMGVVYARTDILIMTIIPGVLPARTSTSKSGPERIMA